MYQPMLYLHWKQVRYVLLLFAVAAFALPLLSVQGLGAPAPGVAGLRPYVALTSTQTWLAFPPLLALAIGVTLGLSAWNWDHQLNHVYALSLPIPRWQYATLRMGAGAVLALLPVAAFWVGAHVATASISLPQGLHAYPNQLTLRFLAAILLSYAVISALAAGTIKTTLWVVGAVSLVFILSGGASLMAPHFPVVSRSSDLQAVIHYLTSLPGPLHVFTGSWALIDV